MEDVERTYAKLTHMAGAVQFHMLENYQKKL